MRYIKRSIGLLVIFLIFYGLSIKFGGQIAVEVRDVATIKPGVAASSFKPGRSRSRVLFYNRIGKCGSRNIIYKGQRLSKIHNFTFDQSLDFSQDHPPENEMIEEIKKISQLKPPTFYNRHIHFLDFNKYGYEEPIYINVVRDPIARFESQYNYMKYGDAAGQVKEPKNDLPDINECVTKEIGLCATNFMFYIGMYFCGFEAVCNAPSEARVKLAKKHIDENYAFIGLTEELDNSLTLLMRLFPEYFLSDSSDSMIDKVKKKTTTHKKDILSSDVKEKLRYHLMKDEYEVYYYAKRKFEDLKKKYGIY